MIGVPTCPACNGYHTEAQCPLVKSAEVPFYVVHSTGEKLIGPPPCAACTGVCCSSNAGFRFVTLNAEEQRNPIFAKVITTHPEAHVRGFWYLPKMKSKGGYCPFFDAGKNQCGIYSERPQNCHNFDCRALGRDDMFFSLNPSVLTIIEQSITRNPRV